jgi:hypothetical protein
MYLPNAGFEVLTAVSMKSMNLLKSTSISEERILPPFLRSKRRQESLLFKPEDGDDMYLRNVGEHLPNYMVLQSKITHSSSNMYLTMRTIIQVSFELTVHIVSYVCRIKQINCTILLS